MESMSMRVSDIIRMQDEARKQNRIPLRSQARDPEEFAKIFEEKCEELNDERKTILQD